MQNYVEYSEDNIEKSKRLSNMAFALSRDVLHCMKNFRVVVQPIVSSTDGKMVGGETLLRWRFEGEDVSPAVFIPLLEKNNMIHAVGRWVFEQTVCTCLRVQSYCSNFYLSFNVSLQQMSDTFLPDVMTQTLAKYGIDGSLLVAEVTESCMDADAENLRRFAEICGEKGIRIALDDFGSGYSSLNMLKDINVDVLKIDMRFLDRDDRRSKDIMESVIRMARWLDLPVIAEGVETREQVNFLFGRGVLVRAGLLLRAPRWRRRRSRRC